VKFWSMVSMIREDMRFFRRLDVDGISSETWCQDDWYPLNMYAYAKLAWNPDLKTEKIIADFCRRCYSKASEPMITYWTLLEEGLRESWKSGGPVDWRDTKRAALLKAALAQANDADVQERIRAVAALHHVSIGTGSEKE
jgi:hypothetical protein